MRVHWGLINSSILTYLIYIIIFLHTYYLILRCISNAIYISPLFKTIFYHHTLLLHILDHNSIVVQVTLVRFKSTWRPFDILYIIYINDLVTYIYYCMHLRNHVNTSLYWKYTSNKSLSNSIIPLKKLKNVLPKVHM